MKYVRLREFEVFFLDIQRREEGEMALDQVSKGCGEGLNGRERRLKVQNERSVVNLPKL